MKVLTAAPAAARCRQRVKADLKCWDRRRCGTRRRYELRTNKAGLVHVDVSGTDGSVNFQRPTLLACLTILCQFFRLARTRRLVPSTLTRGLTRQQSKEFRGRALTMAPKLVTVVSM